jgi:hypothetical protein
LQAEEYSPREAFEQAGVIRGKKDGENKLKVEDGGKGDKG